MSAIQSERNERKCMGSDGPRAAASWASGFTVLSTVEVVVAAVTHTIIIAPDVTTGFSLTSSSS